MSDSPAGLAPTIPGAGSSATPTHARLATAVLMVGALMDLLDGTIVNVALPSIQRGLGASATQVQWVVSGYMLAFAATLITAGRLGDLMGRRRLFVVGETYKVDYNPDRSGAHFGFTNAFTFPDGKYVKVGFIDENGIAK